MKILTNFFHLFSPPPELHELYTNYTQEKRRTTRTRRTDDDDDDDDDDASFLENDVVVF